MAKGWVNESERHRMAKYGIKTGRKKPSLVVLPNGEFRHTKWNKNPTIVATEKPNITPKPKGFEIWDVEDPDGAGMNKEQYLQMWQHLVDTGQAWSLQGWYGRTAQALLDAGEIKYPKKKTYDYYGNPIRTR